MRVRRTRPTRAQGLEGVLGQLHDVVGRGLGDRAFGCEERQAIALANRTGTVIVLKGARTLVTDGRQAYRNISGNPGMATGGSGDVLTGITAALLAQPLAVAADSHPFGAACLATYWHGLAGDHAAARLGEVSLIASDLLRFLPTAIRGGGDEPATSGPRSA